MASDHFQCQVEEEVYSLLMHWAFHCREASPGREKVNQELLKDLLRRLRYHHLSTDFLANVIAHSETIQQAGLLPHIMTSSLVYRDADRRLAKEKGLNTEKSPDRGTGKCWECVQFHIRQEEVLDLQEGEHVTVRKDLVCGYILTVSVTHTRGLDNKFVLSCRLEVSHEKKHPPVGFFRSRVGFQTYIFLNRFEQHQVDNGNVLEQEVKEIPSSCTDDSFSSKARNATLFEGPWLEVVKEG
jgi:hypothetical protein